MNQKIDQVMQQTIFAHARVEYALQEVLSPYNRVFLVIGNTIQVIDRIQGIVSQLQQRFQLVSFSDFSENPKYEEVLRGAELFRQESCDCILAIGGGSTIDLAKAINIFSCHDADLPQLTNSQNIRGTSGIRGKSVSLLVVPTTAGTGTEATRFAVCYQNRVKYSLDSRFILPDIAILDATLTYTMPAYLRACTGIDAFAQAMESYWNVRSTEESRHYARKALVAIWHNLPLSLEGQDNAQQVMLEAAHWAGKAIDITRTTAPHAISYFFTSHYGLPHGHAVALSLASVLRLNYKVTTETCNDPRGVAFVKTGIEDLAGLLDFSSVDAMAEELEAFITRMGLELNIRKYLKDNTELQHLLDTVNLVRLQNNPRKLSRSDLELILAR